MATLTRDGALKAIMECKEVIDAWEQWRPTEDEKHLYGNMWVKPLGDESVQAFSVLTDRFFTTDIAVDAHELAMAVDRFREELRRWLQDRAAVGDGRGMPASIDPRGSSEMWRAYREILHLTTARRKLPPPSAKIQKEQGANARSIAMRFGWWIGPDQPDVDRVMRELSAKPEDEEYDPSTWVHPREEQRHREIEEQWQARCRVIEQEKSVASAPRRSREACKESIEELANMRGMTVRQIALLKCLTEQQVQVELAHLGIYLDHSGVHQRRGGLPDETEEERLRQYDPHDECGEDIDARIVAMHEDHVKPRNIAKKLTHCLGKTVTAQKVGRVINDHKRRELFEDSEAPLEIESVA